jgi:hypothetical protein
MGVSSTATGTPSTAPGYAMAPYASGQARPVYCPSLRFLRGGRGGAEPHGAAIPIPFEYPCRSPTAASRTPFVKTSFLGPARCDPKAAGTDTP